MTNLLGRIIFLLNILLFFYTLLAYQVVYTSNVSHWVGGFIGLSLGPAILLNGFFLILWLIMGSSRAFLSLIIILIGLPLIGRTVRFHTESTTSYSGTKLSLLSYNLMYGDAFAFIEDKDSANAIGIVTAADTLLADIKCFQEFYNNSDIPTFQLIDKFSQTHPNYTYTYATPENKRGQGEIGLAIFSKYPIIKKQEVDWGINNNGMLIADLKVGRDTLRVINVQMRSMGIRVNKVIDAKEDEDLAKKEARNVLSQLKHGFEARGIEVNELIRWLDESPYPVLLAGDFNEIPYGYAYGKVRKKLANAFENKGFGFGFTYNRLPNFIRIDNQFYNGTAFDLQHFATRSDIPYSDHYPILGIYIIKKQKVN